MRSFRALYAKGVIVFLLDGWRMFWGQSIPLFRLSVVMRMQMWNRTMRLIEWEFYDLEAFSSREDFPRKAVLYQDSFNFVHP